MVNVDHKGWSLSIIQIPFFLSLKLLKSINSSSAYIHPVLNYQEYLLINNKSNLYLHDLFIGKSIMVKEYQFFIVLMWQRPSHIVL
jgi:hypothetical protein